MCRIPAVAVLLLISFAFPASGEEPNSEKAPSPGANRADEPLIDSFSLEAAVGFLDQSSMDWTQSRKCFTCHTNYAFLLARPAVSAKVETHRRIRSALEELVEKRWADNGPRWDAEVVMSAAVLALNDAATTREFHPTTRKALDRMWRVQREDGGVDWLKCGWPPMESDDEFGAAMIAIAAGAAPESYRKTPAAKAGIEKLQGYLSKHKPPTLHHQAMLLWADSYLKDLLKPEDREESIQQLLNLQKPDGGWGLATLGNWKRGDGKEQDTKQSDGYGTGFVVYVLRRAGVPAENPQIQKGITWLKQNQRASGRWFTRSLNKDSKHYISHAGTAFAILAISACQDEETAK